MTAFPNTFPMEYTKLVTFCSVLCVVYVGAAVVQKDYHCEFPTQWQSKVFMDTGAMIWIPEQMNGSGSYFYDYPNQQMRLDVSGYALGNYHFNFTFIWKFHEKAVYTLDNNNNTCGREEDSIAVWNQWGGVPSDAEMTSNGGLGGFKEIVSQYSLVRNAGDADAVVTLDVKVGDICSPLRISFQALHLGPISGEMVNYDFLDAMPLSDSKVFDTPSHCVNTTLKHNEIVKRLLPTRYIGIFMG